jgi:hypothetical protein
LIRKNKVYEEQPDMCHLYTEWATQTGFDHLV